MKINSFNKGIIDTDMLPDGQAEIAEEIERVKKFVLDRNGEIFVWVKIPGKQAWCSINLTEAASIPSVVEALDMGVGHATGNKVGVSLVG